MACECCKSIDLNKLALRKRVPHHATFKELETCSRVCELCSWIKESLEERLANSRVFKADYGEKKVHCRVPGYTLDGADNDERWRGFKVVFFAVDMGEGVELWTDDIEFFVPRGSVILFPTASILLLYDPISPRID
jgi:hypothetical protein